MIDRAITRREELTRRELTRREEQGAGGLAATDRPEPVARRLALLPADPEWVAVSWSAVHDFRSHVAPLLSPRDSSATRPDLFVALAQSAAAAAERAAGLGLERDVGVGFVDERELRLFYLW